MEFILSALQKLLFSPLLLLGSILSGLFLYISAIIIYRLTLHPLSSYPGPFLAKISDIYLAWYAYRGSRHLALYHAHVTYGSYVRVGPNTISINTAPALKQLYSFRANVQKSDFYKAFPVNPRAVNVHSSIDKRVHARKRRVLAHAFSDAAIKSLERYILMNVRVGIGILAKGDVAAEKTRSVVLDIDGHDGSEKNGDGWGPKWDVGKWANYLVFDIMGDLVFGKGFGMLESEQNRFAVELVGNAAHRHLICGTHLTLHKYHLDHLLFPHISRQRSQYMNYSKTQALARTKQGLDIDRRDFFYHLLNAKDPETGAGFSMDELWGESNLLIIAGSDTTSTALAATLFYLSRNPKKRKLLEEEIRSAFGPAEEEEIVTGPKLNSCTYLRACIDEALRLTPPVAGMLPREVLPGGTDIEGHHFPAGTVLGVPHYAVHHNPEYYPEPFSFVPERWISSPDRNPYINRLDAAHAAFCPFSIGPRGCIGKGLAYVELSITLARIVWGFDIAAVEGETLGEGRPGWEWGRERKDEFQIKDVFASSKEGPILRFRRRAGLDGS